MKHALFLRGLVWKFLLIGMGVGICFSLFGMAVLLEGSGVPLNFAALRGDQAHQPIIWIIETTPLFFGLAFALFGIREERLRETNRSLEQSISARTMEVENLSQNLHRENEERRKVEELISRGKKEWEGTFDAISDLIFIADDQDRVIRCNRAAAEKLHKSYGELILQPLAALLSPHGLVSQDLARQGRDIEFSALEGRYDISIYPLAIDASSASNLYILHDITDRHQAEQEMLRQKKHFEALVIHNPAAIVVLDNEGRVQSCNPAFEKLFGYPRDEVIGQVIDPLVTTPAILQEAELYTRQALEGPIKGMGVRRRKDNSSFDVEILAVPVKVENVKVGTLAIYHDISELQRARQEAEAANQAKSEFLANMSHEIRTPMNGIMGMVELTLDTQLTDEQREYLRVALQSAETLLTLINDILDYSKIEAGKLELENIDFNLRTTVEDVAFSLASRAQSKGLEMACMVHPELAGNLKGDPARLRQILVNLVGNAIKFTHQGEIVIQAEPLEIGDQNGKARIRFSVQDTGIGIPKERQLVIFERFTQADGSTTRRYGGTGLGLTICKQLVAAMGGEIRLESAPGVGSTFSFEISFERQPLPPQGKTQPLQMGSVEIRGMNLLIVDDNRTNRLVLSRMAEGLHCRTNSASSGAKALEMLRLAYKAGDPYRVVLLDMQMPGMDGEATARAMLSDPAGQDTKIIVLTSMGQRGDASRLKAMGCSAYLVKPVKQHLLYDAVIAVLGQKDEPEQGNQLVTRHSLSEARRQEQKILLAEDNPVNQKLTTIILQKAGYSVDAVQNGVEAFEKLKNETYSAILMDVQMPEMDGLEATRMIRADTTIPKDLPIIAMTAHALKGDRELCLEAGMNDYVSKPVTSQGLLAVLERWTSASLEHGERGSHREGGLEDGSSQPNELSSEKRLLGEDAPTPEGAAIESPSFIKEESPLPMDLEAAMQLFENDKAFFLEMGHDFMEHMPGRLQELRTSLEKNDTATFSRAAHNLKGVSANFSATMVNRISAEMERAARQDDLSTAPELLERLEAEVRRLFDYLLSLGVEGPASPESEKTSS